MMVTDVTQRREGLELEPDRAAEALALAFSQYKDNNILFRIAGILPFKDIYRIINRDAYYNFGGVFCRPFRPIRRAPWAEQCWRTEERLHFRQKNRFQIRLKKGRHIQIIIGTIIDLVDNL